MNLINGLAFAGLVLKALEESSFYRNSYLDSLTQLRIWQMVMMLVIRERHDDGMITSLMNRLMKFVMAIIIRCPDSEPPLGHAIAIWIHQTNSRNG